MNPSKIVNPHEYPDSQKTSPYLNNSNPTSLKELNLSTRQFNELPPAKFFFCFTNLRSLNLSHNLLDRFNPSSLLEGAPFLEDLNLSHNYITTLDDIIELGSLKSLQKLNVLENPISKLYIRMKLLESLLFPKKYQPYEGVKILTATYNLASVDTNKKANIYVSKSPGIFGDSKPRSSSTGRSTERGVLTANQHEGNLIRLSLQKCPVPRKTRFPMLSVFNERIISIQDLQSILAKNDLGEILLQTDQKENHEGIAKPVRFEKLHKKYLDLYVRKKLRKKEAQQGPSLRQIAHYIRDDDDLRILYQADRIDYQKRKKERPDYEDELWKGPFDLKLRNTEFNIGIKEYNEMIREHDQKQQESNKKERKIIATLKIKTSRENSPEKRKSYTQRGNKSGLELGDGQQRMSFQRVSGQNGQRKEDNRGIQKENSERDQIRCSESTLPEQEESVMNTTEKEQFFKKFGIQVNNPEELTESDDKEVLIGDNALTIANVSMAVSVAKELKKTNSLSRQDNKGKQVFFNVEKTPHETTDGLSCATPQLSLIKRSPTMSPLSSPRLDVNPVFIRMPSQSPVIEIKKVKAKREIVKKFTIVQESVPNVSLPMFVDRSKSAPKLRKTQVLNHYQSVNVISSDNTSNTKDYHMLKKKTTSQSQTYFSTKLNANSQTDELVTFLNSNQNIDPKEKSVVLQPLDQVQKATKIDPSQHTEGQTEIGQVFENLTITSSHPAFKLSSKKYVNSNVNSNSHLQPSLLNGSAMDTLSLSVTVHEEHTQQHKEENQAIPKITEVFSVYQKEGEPIHSTNLTNPNNYEECQHEPPANRAQSAQSINVYNEICTRLMESRNSERQQVVRKKAQKVRDEAKEMSKLSKIIFLNRSKSTLHSAKRIQSASTSANTSLYCSRDTPMNKTARKEEVVDRVNKVKQIEGKLLYCKILSDLLPQQRFLKKNDNHSLLYKNKNKTIYCSNKVMTTAAPYEDLMKEFEVAKAVHDKFEEQQGKRNRLDSSDLIDEDIDRSSGNTQPIMRNHYRTRSAGQEDLVINRVPMKSREEQYSNFFSVSARKKKY